MLCDQSTVFENVGVTIHQHESETGLKKVNLYQNLYYLAPKHNQTIFKMLLNIM